MCQENLEKNEVKKPRGRSRGRGSIKLYSSLIHPVLKERTSTALDSELRSCVKVEVAVLGSPSLTVLMVSADVKQH